MWYVIDVVYVLAINRARNQYHFHQRSHHRRMKNYLVDANQAEKKEGKRNAQTQEMKNHIEFFAKRAER